MKRYVCQICGYIHEGDEPPLVCPICDANFDDFEAMDDENQ